MTEIRIYALPFYQKSQGDCHLTGQLNHFPLLPTLGKVDYTVDIALIKHIGC